MRVDSLLLCVGLLLALTQPEAQDKYSVEGTVVNSATSQPVVRAWVTLRAKSGDFVPASSLTDGQGHFSFTGLAGGEYSIEAHRDNFLSGQARPLTLAKGEQKKDLVLQLTPFGAIAGHVTTEEGDAIPELDVTAMVYDYRQGGRELVSRRSATTNDRGEYRLFGMPAGKYVLKTAQRKTPRPDEIYEATYYPGATHPSGAVPLELGAGQELDGTDFMLRRTHAATVRGRVVAPAGASYLAAALDMYPSGTVVGNARGDEQGRIEFRSVAPGTYFLRAFAGVGEKVYSTRHVIQVTAGDVEGIELRLAPPVDLNGAVRIEGNTSVKPSQLAITFNDGRPPIAVKNDGTFVCLHLPPMVHHPTALVPGDLFVKSIRCGNTDVAESGVDLTGGGGCDLVITVSANGGRIEGNVVDENAQPVADAMVTLVPKAVGRTGFFKATTPDARGHFSFMGVAPGAYHLYAWEEADFNAVRYDPDFVRPFETLGRSLQIGEGTRENVNLKRIGKPAGR